jgi:hypothetical protein|tara:strand:- start:265 stop:498 length:234 start_codon:yes stop_codon:yes gene_type:complete
MQEKDIRAIREAYQLVFNTEDGQTVLEDLKKRFHIHGTVFSTEPTDTAYREGQRTVVLFIQSMLLDWDNLLKEQDNE